MQLVKAIRLSAFIALAGATTVARADAAGDFVIAVENDRVAQVREYLGKGVDPNTVALNGEPVLVVASRAGYAGTVDALVAGKPERHRFDIAASAPAVERHMSVTGG